MRIGLRLPPCAPAPAVAELASAAEAAGFDEVWFPDSQLLWRDVFTVTAAAAMVTDRIQLGIAVTNVVTRHHSVLASATRTVAELAPGRFVLGVGVGNSSLAPVGLPPATGAQLRARVGAVRTLLSGAAVDFGPVSSRLRDPHPVPIYMAASGPRNLRLAGEIADGAILLSGTSPALLEEAIGRVQEGGQAVGRPRVPVTVSAFCRVTDDLARDARELKPICAGVAQNGGTKFLQMYGVHVDVPASIPGVYPDLVHAEDWDQAVSACDPYVSDEAVIAFARGFCLFGTADEIAERINAIEAAGADAVFLQHVGSYDLPEVLLHDIADYVIPVLGAPSAAAT
jgi:5,10-methylenetetrahydromethanopterin reductase